MNKKNYYGIDPYLYDDPYTILAKAQFGYDMPIEADYKSYPEFKEAYATWLALNRPEPTDSIPIQTPSLGLIAPKKSSRSRGLTDYSGTSVVDFLTDQGVASDYKTRASLAKALGISNYTRKADQNLLMMDMVRKNPEILNMLPTMLSSKKGRKSSKSLPNSPNATNLEIEEDEDGNKTIIDSTGVRTTIDSVGNVINIDTAGASTAVDTTGGIPLDATGKLPKPTGGSDKTSDVTKALAGMAGIAIAGGLTYASFKEAEQAAQQLAKTSGVSADLLKSSFKKIKPKIAGAVKAYENMGVSGQEMYNQIENLIATDENIAKTAFTKEVKQAMKTGPLKSYTPELAKEFQQFKASSSPRAVNILRDLERESGLTKLKSPSGKLASGKLPTPTFSNRAASAFDAISKSKPVTRLNQFRKELDLGTKTANALRKTANFVGGARKFLRFEEGGENQQDGMQQLMQYIAMQLQQGTSKSEIIEALISATQGSIDQQTANDLIDSVANQLGGGEESEENDLQSQMQYGPASNEQMMGQEGMMPEKYQNGGGYSGTYDAGSGSYFAQGGSFVPTYGDILPEYMYGADMMEDGGTYGVGDTLDVSPEEMEYLRQQGYDFDIV